jgi:hypothetical protein
MILAAADASPAGSVIVGLAALALMWLLPHATRFYGPPDRLYDRFGRRQQPTRPPVSQVWHAQPGPNLGPGTTVRRVHVGHGEVVRRPPQPPMPNRPHLSGEYTGWIDGRLGALDHGPRWPVRRDGWLAEHRVLRGGWCEYGLPYDHPDYARFGVPTTAHGCDGRAQATQADHLHYNTLRREQRWDVALVCRGCHVIAEHLKDHGVKVVPA